LKSEKAIPLGDAREYLSCAPTVVPPRNASAAVVIAIVNLFALHGWFSLNATKPEVPENKLEI